MDQVHRGVHGPGVSVFGSPEKIIFNGMLERNDLNYQPMTDMTQCASELSQIKSFIFKTIVEYISTCTLSYMFCMFFRGGSTCYMLKIHKTNKLCSRMSGMI